MGGSGGSWVGRMNPADLARRVRESEQRETDASFEAAVAEELGNLLARYNDRDIDLVRSRLDDAKDALKGLVAGTIDPIFGGSVAKKTYVDGLSDVDSLVIFDDRALFNAGPAKVLQKMANALEQYLGGRATVSAGRMAVTLHYSDGMTIQLLPAARQKDGRLRVPSSRNAGTWSSINPEAFQAALTRRNGECGGKLVPVVKLAKAIVGTLPDTQRLSGYHMESLAIAAFRGYNGPKTTMAMLPTFFERARELVRSPIRDSTGQSVHVDGYLGDAESEARIAASHVLGAIAKRMRNATAARSLPRWRALFGSDD